jgi:hypothetical protein
MKLRGCRPYLIGFLLVTASCSGTEDSRVQDEAAAPQAPGSSTAGSAIASATQVQLEELEALVDRIAADAAALPSSDFDPAVLARSLGDDPDRLFEWVRDRTWWAPYRGLLRGPRGVMLDRLGSNLDRAVLLGDLMRHAGHTIRLAHATLPERDARELLADVRTAPERRRGPTESVPRMNEAGAIVRSQFDELHAILLAVAPRHAADDRVAVSALQDHWWVEREANGEWIAYDVLRADSKAGDTFATASEWSEWNAADDAPSIPAADWHTVKISVVVERYAGGSVTESGVLDTVLRPAEALGRRIILGHVPRPWPETLRNSTSDPGALKNAALWVTEWAPYLQVGENFIARSAFSDSGDPAILSKDSAAGLSGATGAGLDFFGSSLGGGEETESFATAEWIDFEIRVPGVPIRTLRRPVFDLLGPARRSAGSADFDGNDESLRLQRFEALRSQTDILLQPCDFTAEYLVHLALAGILAERASFKELAGERDASRARELASEILGRMISSPLPDVALWRSVLGRQHWEWFIDQPNILSYRISLPVVDASRVAVNELIDFAANPTGIRWGSGSPSFETRLRQGVADTVAEMLALGSDLSEAANTASIFAMLTGVDGDHQMALARDTASVRALSWPPDETARLMADISAGYVAVVPKNAVTLHGRERVGWWRIDPSSGATIGVMDTGYHAVDEREELEATIAQLEAHLSKDAAEWGVLRAGIHRSQVGRSIRWYPKELRQRDNLEQLLNILETAAGR